MMDLIHQFMNLVVLPSALITLFLFLPSFLFFKFLLFIIRSLFSENVAGRVALITGASSGIGEELAYQYAKRGACLVLVARREKSLQEVSERARELGSPEVLSIRADVSKLDDCKRFIDQALDHFGRLDHVVNNAGVISLSMFEEFTDVTDSSPVMDINFWGSVYTTHLAVPHLKRSRGKIIVIASSGGWFPVPRLSIYNASKAALISFFETLKVELGEDIGITIVTPGYIESEMTKGKYLKRGEEMEVDQEKRDVMVGMTPVVSVEGCAKSILNSACRGDRYLTEPSWYSLLYLWKVLCPEVVEWCCRLLYAPGPGASQIDALSKKILHFTGAKIFLYPSSIRSTGPAIKSD